MEVAFNERQSVQNDHRMAFQARAPITQPRSQMETMVGFLTYLIGLTASNRNMRRVRGVVCQIEDASVKRCKLAVRQNTMSDEKRYQVLFCDGPSCGGCYGSGDLKEEFLPLLTRLGAGQRVSVIDYTCFGRCSDGPNLLVRELPPEQASDAEPSIDDIDGVLGFYSDLDSTKLERIAAEHCVKGVPIEGEAEEY